MMVSTNNINNIFEKYGVTKDRAEHSLEVAKIAVELAKINDVSLEKAWLAGALHDIARDWSDEKRIDYATKNSIYLDADDNLDPILNHSKIGAYICKKELCITDTDTLQAIISHTSGRADMTPLEEIIYIADFVESTISLDEFQPIRDMMRVSSKRAISLINTAMAKYITSLGKSLSHDFLENQKYYSKY